MRSNVSDIVIEEEKRKKVVRLPEGELRRIRFVNYICMIAIASMISYASLYTFLNLKLFLPAILFLSGSSVLTIFILLANNKGYHLLSKVLLALFVPLYMSSTATWLFGREVEFHNFLFASMVIPPFLWSVKEVKYLVVFMGFSLFLYVGIEFFPPVFEPIIKLPEEYISGFKSSSTLMAFLVVAVAVIIYFKLTSQQEQSLIKQASELEANQQHQNMVYSVIAHDLKSPLAGLQNMSGLLIKEDEANDNKHLKCIYESSKAVNMLLENLLSWTKIKSGNLVVRKESFCLINIVYEVETLLNEFFRIKKINFINNVEEGECVMADENMVSTVLRNLIANSVKFTKIGGEVGINAKRVNGKVEIVVHDTGIGISENNLKKLFNEALQFSTLGTNMEKGSGLGLVLCRDFVKANGGEIWGESELGKGTRVYFTLEVGQVVEN